MLHEFISRNRDELIQRCRENARQRLDRAEIPADFDHGVPLFLAQLVETLKVEPMTTEPPENDHDDADSHSGIKKAAELHGAELLEFGLTVDQVVHRYGDVCQSVTGLAIEQNVTIETDEFRILNRCLDNAIASAAASFGQARQLLLDDETKSLYENIKSISDERRRLVDVAIQSFDAIRAGTVGSKGATGILLAHVLEEMRTLDDCAVFYPRALPSNHKSL